MKDFIQVFGTLSALMGVLLAFSWIMGGISPAFAIFFGAVSGAVIFGGIFAMRWITGPRDGKISRVFEIRLSIK